jgi:hypothetical protein
MYQSEFDLSSILLPSDEYQNKGLSSNTMIAMEVVCFDEHIRHATAATRKGGATRSYQLIW